MIKVLKSIFTRKSEAVEVSVLREPFISECGTWYYDPHDMLESISLWTVAENEEFSKKEKVMSTSIIEMVKDKKVTFVCFKENELIYVTECGFEFPISIEEAKGATFLPEDKATLFMRWIRKHLKFIDESK
jgi:hypothetical protein